MAEHEVTGGNDRGPDGDQPTTAVAVDQGADKGRAKGADDSLAGAGKEKTPREMPSSAVRGLRKMLSVLARANADAMLVRNPVPTIYQP